MLSEFYNYSLEEDPNLNQGKLFKYYEDEYKRSVLPHLPLLEATSAPFLSSIIETLDNNDSTKQKNLLEIQSISHDEQKFNKILAEYTKTYNLFMEDIMKQGKLKKEFGNYFGEVIHEDNGAYIYINKFGVTHKYKPHAWVKKDESCPQSAIDGKGQNFNQLQSGPEMGNGQACKIAGHNIKNKETGEHAWVDIKGYKHVYKDNVWDKKSKECKKRPSLTLPSKAYDAIPSSSPMESSSYCDTISLNPSIWRELIKFNEELLSLAAQIKEKTIDLGTNNSEIKKKMRKRGNAIENYKKELNKDKRHLKNINKKDATIGGELESSLLVLEGHRMKFIIWILAGLIIILITATASAHQNILPAFIILVLFGIFIIYKFTNWISRKI
jgi:hypothetical protein